MTNPSARPTRDELIGKTIGQYEILQEVGRGGMATVYRAMQLSMNRPVAVKVLPRSLLHDPTFYDRFMREVDLISRLEHPHIVPIYDYGEADGMPYIAMRFLGGGSLAQLVRASRVDPLPLHVLMGPLSQVAQALDYAHKRGVVHRDLKPGNVLLDEVPEGDEVNVNAYLSDFGIARMVDSNMTGSALIGTPAYMSPEQAKGEVIDGRSDVYALGIVTFELITGREPFAAETPVALILQHINEPLPSIRDLRPDVPGSVEEVVRKATSKDRDLRYSSAKEFTDAFSQAVENARQGGFALLGQSLANILRLTHITNPPPTAANTGYSGAAPGTGSLTPARSTPAPLPVSTPQDLESPTLSPSQIGMASVPLTPAVIVERERRRANRLQTVSVIAILAIVGLAAAVVYLALRQPPPAPAPVLPTPFPVASTLVQGNYTISMPNDWIPPTLFEDLSADGVQRHRWTSADSSAQVTLEIVPLDEGVAFADAAGTHREQSALDASYQLVDSETAQDGSIRRSYRRAPTPDGTQPGGQLDVFYLSRAPYLAVVSLFSADSTGNTFVPTFQLILDSLRVPPPA